MATRKKDIELLTADDVSALVAQCSRRAPSGIRDSALLWTLYGAALRIGEALSLVRADLNLDKREVRVKAAKGGKQRLVGLHPDAVPYLARWLELRTDLPRPKKGPVVCCITKGKKGEPIYRQAVDNMIRRRAQKAGITKRVHCHGLRHSMAVRMSDGGIPMPKIMEQLGHSSLAVTTAYLAHFTASGLSEAMADI